MSEKSKFVIVISTLASIATIIGICIGVIALIPAFGQWLFPVSPIPTSTNSNLAVTPNIQLIATTTPPHPTDILSPTNAPLPINTPFLTIQPTVTIIPSSPTSAIQLPFSDNFNKGSDPKWHILNGPWMTTAGRYTTLGPTNGFRNEWLWSVLDGSNWGNYRVKLDYKINNPYSANQGQMAIAVRMSNGQRLSFVVDYFMQSGWAFVDSNSNNPQYIGVSRGKDVPVNGTIELDMIGNNFTGYVNGSEIQTINISGFEIGGVGLGVYCDNSPECPSFDNFSIEPIN